MTPDAIGMIFEILLKLLTLVGIGIYIVFASVVVRQEQLMSKALVATSEKIISILTWLHLGASVFAFFLALLIL